MKVKIALAAFLSAAVLLVLNAGEDGGKYMPNWASLDTRPTPKWWVDAKFGIFVHWGPYSVPAYSPMSGKEGYANYAEWYPGQLARTNAEVVAYHRRVYGDVPYANLAAQFRAENFNAAKWARIFKKAGARYAVLTSKHHDGYALWPSPDSPYYNSVALGSGRDLCGEFVAAMRAEGLKCGFYYSLLEHGNARYRLKVRDVPAWGRDALSVEEWAGRMNHPQMKDLVERYHADILWPDGDWDWPSADQRSEEFLAWLFNESCMRDTIVINDRWGRECRGRHGGHYTTEYGNPGDGAGNPDAGVQHPWEECRGIGMSFGHNRMETAENYMTSAQCVATLIDIVSRGGNLLLNVGPTADGRIPPIMEDRLLAIGRWLDVNGEAIYGTTRWTANQALRERGLHFTRKGSSLYLIATRWPGQEVEFSVPGKVKSVTLLGSQAPVLWSQDGSGVRMAFPDLSVQDLPCEHAWTIRIEFVL